MLNERTNVKKVAAKRPVQYFVDQGITARELEGHTMPRSFLKAVDKGNSVLKWQWAVERYDHLVEERCEELARPSTSLQCSFGDEVGVPAGSIGTEVRA